MLHEFQTDFEKITKQVVDLKKGKAHSLDGISTYQ